MDATPMTCHVTDCVEPALDGSPFCRVHWRKTRPTEKRALKEGTLTADALAADLATRDLLICQAYRYEIRPTKEQQRWLGLHCRLTRLVYNWGLEQVDGWWQRNREKAAADREERPDEGTLYTRFAREVVPLHPWIADTAASTRSYALKSLFRAFANFFARCKQKKGGANIRAGYPRFHGRKDGERFALQPASGPAETLKWMSTHVQDKAIKLPKVGWMRTKERTRMTGRVLRLSFEGRAGRWWMTVMVEREAKAKHDPIRNVVGIDFGINSVITLSRPAEKPYPEFLSSNGFSIEPPMPLGKTLKAYKRASRSLSRRHSVPYQRMLLALLDHPEGLTQKRLSGVAKLNGATSYAEQGLRLRHIVQDGDLFRLTDAGRDTVGMPVDDRVRPSKRWLKQKRRLQKLALVVSDIRLDHVNKVTTWLVEHYGTIVVEGYDIQRFVEKKGGAIRNRKRRREFGDAGIGLFRQRLAYKCGWRGRRYMQLPADEPTDVSCHACGTINEASWNGKFSCTQCGVSLPRQVNTALYCESFGREPESTGGHPGTDARGEAVSRGGNPTQASKGRRKAKGSGNGNVARRPGGDPGAPFLAKAR